MMKQPTIQWPPTPTQWSLESGEVQVWATSLSRTPQQIAASAKTLSADEQARADRFRFDRDRNRFMAGRGVLRAILGHALNKEPVDIKFAYSERGKPRLIGHEAVRFNLAHTEDMALLAVARDWNVGVDVERIRALRDADGVAKRFFSARESNGLNALSGDEKNAAFFNLWTRKEAWLKATGDGIADGLNQVEVTFRANEPVRLISLFGDEQAVREWSLVDLAPAPEFVAALAVPARDVRVRCWHWMK
ncbi:MAG: 4-phosphopantetheinyl transferase [Pedosphaera sp.]|nr:4-phosphopantetheinyl transferase [Pedosphaera sp.]